MSKYIINKNKQDPASGGNYEVHNEETCYRLPNIENRINLGYFSNCSDAMKKAKTMYPEHTSKIDGCFYCCEPCHKK